MRIGLRRQAPGGVEFGLIYGVIAVLGLLAARFLPVARLAPCCPFLQLTGIPCPTCGGTRAAVLLAHGNVSAALFMNPLTTLAFLGALLFLFLTMLLRTLGLPRIAVDLTDRETNAVRALAVLAVLVQWVYLSFSL